jgi:Tfp pilus assembly protein PilF
MKMLALGLVAVSLMFAACAAPQRAERTLHAPAGTDPAIVTIMEEGNRLFQARQFKEAKIQYEAAIKAQPSLAEAHYNLGWALSSLGDETAARAHFMEAATLAPGNKVIWDSPPLRQHGQVEAHPKSSGAVFTPALGGH